MADDELNLTLILTGVILSFSNTFLPHLLRPVSTVPNLEGR